MAEIYPQEGGSGANADLTYVTSGDESAGLPNSRQLVDGTNTTIDTSTPGQIKVNASGGGGSPGGNNTNVQFNNSSAFDGSDDFTFSPTGPTLHLGTSTDTTPSFLIGDNTLSTQTNLQLKAKANGTTSFTLGSPSITGLTSAINLWGPTTTGITFWDGAGRISFYDASNTNETRISPVTPTGFRTLSIPDADCNPIRPSAGVAGQYVEYVDSDGVQHLSTPSASVGNPLVVGTEGSVAGSISAAGSGANNRGRVLLTGNSTGGTIVLGSVESTLGTNIELNGPGSDPPRIAFKVNDGGGGSGTARIAAAGGNQYGTSYYTYLPARPNSTDLYFMQTTTASPTEGNIPVGRNDGAGDCYYDVVGGSPANSLQFPGNPSGSLQIPHGTNAERDNVNYSIRWNEDDGCLETYSSGYKQYQPVQNIVNDVAGSTSGDLYWSQPNISTANKTVKIRLESFNDAGTTVTFDVAFSYAPAIVFNNTTVTPSSITTTDITLPSTGGAKSGWIILEGF